METAALDETVESKRIEYRPFKVRVLFVGESPPVNGTFFYRGDSNLARYTHEAFTAEFPVGGEMSRFLTAFRDSGCYLVDLCHEPVNGMPRTRRRIARQAGIPFLGATMREAAPEIIIVVMKAIEGYVARAAAEAALNHVPRHVIPFPAQGHQRQYVDRLTMILRDFFRAPARPSSMP
jgi:hypothetical protein